jgi:chromosome segregation ATPase
MVHSDRKGYVAYKQVRLGQGNDIEESIRCLKKAVSISANAEYYLHLALALEHKLETDSTKHSANEKDAGDLQSTLRYALACCDHVKDLDRGIKKSLTQRADELKKRLEKLSEEIKKTRPSKGDCKEEKSEKDSMQVNAVIQMNHNSIKDGAGDKTKPP